MNRTILAVAFAVLSLSVYLPGLVRAENIPTESDVVVIYQTDTETVKHQYLFTIAGDATIYPCIENRCNLSQWQGSAVVTMTVYVLPEGFTTVSNVVNPAVLQSYQSAAERTYVLTDIATQPATNSGRSYQTVTLQADGSYSTAANSYVKPDVKDQRAINSNKSLATPDNSKRYIGLIVAGTGVIAVLGILFYTKRRRI